MSYLQVRKACSEDAPDVAALLGELGFPASAATVAARLEQLVGAGVRVFVATRDQTTLGVVTIHVTPMLHRASPAGRITALVVTERARGQGVGRALVEAAESWIG